MEGKEQIVKFVKQGDIIGFRSVLSGDLACTTAEMLEDGILEYIPKSVLLNLMQNNFMFTAALIRLICRELGEANEFITDIAQKSVKQRLAEALILLKQTFDTDDEGILQVALTREELANIVGTASESVIRLLASFKAEGLIALSGRKIRILREQELRRIGNIPERYS